ncbi:hypothetical protein D9M68_186180 [compost metagenome]
MKARVFTSKMNTSAETVIAAEEAPPAATEKEPTSSLLVASTLMLPSASISMPESIDACVVLINVATLTPAPTAALPPDAASDPATVSRSVSP